MSSLHLTNPQARLLWLAVNGLIPERKPQSSAGDDSASLSPMARANQIVRELGLVQLDPLNPVARAHEHILWTRSHRLRPRHFERLLEERTVFEHFSHDACILPVDTWPYWQRQFDRRAAAMEGGSWGCALPGESLRQTVLARIDREGPLSSRDFEDRRRPSSGAWTKPPHKVALDWLWIRGQLAVTHRRGFIKHYDLVERVIPAAVRERKVDDATQSDWLCRQALTRLGSATPGQLQRFWDVLDPSEIRQWIVTHPEAWQEVTIESAEGKQTRALSPPDVEQRLANLGPVPTRLRIINPFDPVIRDRKRVSSLFGFDFRIEIYVPPAKRRFGYYVFPLLEGLRFIGRIEIRAERANDTLAVKALWLEPGVRLGRGRRDRLQAELARIARLAGVGNVGTIPEI